mmetsp:Transcript_61118/g.73518  ORF Transcript_61118/g.73518 Transcript_61118/m.73518 type:complete len:1066 (-) Transcript_61118:317-3514(-)
MLTMTQPWRSALLTFLLLLTLLLTSQATSQKNGYVDMDQNHNLIIQNDVPISQRENARRDKQTNEAENSPNDEHQKVTDSTHNDEFQVIPLTTTNGNHEATIYVGTPPQALLVSIDTVSPFTFLPCSNTIKMSDNGSFLAYDRQASISYNPSVCRPKEPKCDNFNKFPGTCVNDVQCAFTADTKPTTQYEIGTDVVYAGKFFGQGKDDSFASQYSFRYPLGCAHNTDTVQGGVLGMGNSDESFSHKMAEEGTIGHGMYALCFSKIISVPDNISGMMTLGGFDPRVNNSPMRYARETRRSFDYVDDESFVVSPRNVFLFIDDNSNQISNYGNKVSATDSENFFAFGTKIFNDKQANGFDLDSAYPYTKFGKYMRDAMKVEFKKMTGHELDNKPINGYQRKDIDKMFPTILIQLRAFGSIKNVESGEFTHEPGYAGALDQESKFPNDVILAIKPNAYMEYDKMAKTFTPRIYFNTNGNHGTLGQNAMINHNILFDMENERVGFAESSCLYEDLVGNKEEKLQILEDIKKIGVNKTIADIEIEKEIIKEEEAAVGEGMQVSADCVLGPENEVIACEDTVDSSVCATRSSPYTMVGGTLKVDRVIESPPLHNGQSCEDVIRSESPNSKSTVDVFCDDAGVCSETRTCSVKCMKFAHNADNGGEDYIGNGLNPSFKPEPCGEPFFGSCQYTCEQTQIISLTDNDGNCRESERLTRPCHTSECGRENACLVPFVVHVILIFSDANVELWNRGSEELFREAMSNAISQHPISYQKKIDITPGDIDVLLVTRYHSMVQPDDDGSDNEVETGSAMKVVAEISIYNSDLARTDKIEAFEEQAGVGDAGGGKHVLVNIKCEEDDIVAYAHDALAFNNMFEDKDFMALMYGSIQNVKGMSNAMYADSSAPFDVDISASRESMILSSWTIRSEVGLGAEAQDAKSNVSELLYPLTFIIFLFAVTGCIFRYYGTEVQRDFITMNMAAMAFKRQAGASDVEKGNYASLGATDDELAHNDTFEMVSNNSYELEAHEAEVDDKVVKDSSLEKENSSDDYTAERIVLEEVDGEDFEPSEKQII